MSHPSLLNGIMSHADVSSMMNIYLYMKPIFWFRHDFFFFWGLTAHWETTSTAVVMTLPM
jgi:hypothetical protein